MDIKEKTDQRRKVVIVGAGAVGATYCYALAPLAQFCNPCLLLLVNV